MRGIKIPQQDFALKGRGGLCTRGGIFAGHYGTYLVSLDTGSCLCLRNTGNKTEPLICKQSDPSLVQSLT